MKVVILAGGLGTRISEETAARPKPMIEIGGRPLLWHIMKGYAGHGISEFIVCLGYRGYMVKEYFNNYYLHTSDVTIGLADNSMKVHRSVTEAFTVTLVDTGAQTMTGGRLRRVREYIGNETFCMTYGDGLGNVDITRLLEFHRERKRLATVTVVQAPGRFGAVQLEDSRVVEFHEKPRGDNAWINGGFFVLEPPVLDLVAGDETYWEREPLERLAADQQLSAYRHEGFWHPLDTLRDKTYLEELWSSAAAPWKTWE